MRAYISNIGPFEFFVTRTYGHFHILPATGEPGTKDFRPGVTFIDNRKDRLDLGEQNYYFIDVPGEAIAKDLVETEMLENFGCFVSAGPKPTDQEIARAQQKVLDYCQKKIREADTEWARYKRHELIDDQARRACLILGEEREWAYQVVQKVVCPVCSTKNLVGTAKCGNGACGAILDIDKCLAFGLIDKARAEELKKLRKGQELKTVKEKPGQRAAVPAGKESQRANVTGKQLQNEAEAWTADTAENEEAEKAEV